MTVTIVHIEVLPAHVDDFIQASTENHLESVKEPGNLRFDLLRNEDNPNRFVLYEAYESASAAAAHKDTAHYLRWREDNWSRSIQRCILISISRISSAIRMDLLFRSS